MSLETLRDLWERNARLHAETPAIVFGATRMNYTQLWTRACRLAHALERAGVRAGDRVSILAMNCAEYLEILAANHALGSIAATLNFRLAEPELAWILADASPTVLIFESQYADRVASLRAGLPGIRHYIVLGDELPWAGSYESFLATGQAAPPSRRPRAEDIAHLVYTSGTTGRPKGVMRSHRAEIFQADGMSTGMDIRPGSRILEVMPYFHVGAQSSTWGILWRGGTTFVHRVFDPKAVLETVTSSRITHLHLVPSMIQDLLAIEDLERYDLSSLETILYAAAEIEMRTFAADVTDVDE